MKWMCAAALIGSLVACSSGEVERLAQSNEELEEQIQLLQVALEEANSRVQQAASDISDLQSQALYGECESLKVTIHMMDEPQTVDEP